MTYKILYNDAVAMTGGQPVDGIIDVWRMAAQVAAEGVKRLAIVAEDPTLYTDLSLLPKGTTIHHRDRMDDVQRELREVPGVSVIIYDQTCAAEKRRRRKRGTLATPNRRLVINELVCEGCGDCGVQSNCTSILPLETDFGRKRTIDQASCNLDYSCVKGFCPRFVTVEGGTLRKGNKALAGQPAPDELPMPPRTADTLFLARPFNIFITGVGGTGVITLGALLGMAAHLEGKGVSVLDMTGMSQKNGSVTCHVRLAQEPDALHAQRIATGEGDLLLGCDLLTAGSAEAVAKTRPGRTLAIINSHEQPAGQFTRDADWTFPAVQTRDLITEAVGGRSEFLDATALAKALMGDSIGANLLMLGYAWQKGAIPLSLQALTRAIELNGTAVKSNLQAFQWGRLAALDLARVQRQASPETVVTLKMPESLVALCAKRADFLKAYQNQAYADQYTQFMDKVRHGAGGVAPGDAFIKAVAKSLFKLMAYKDEYEVARLHTDPSMKQAIAAQFEGNYSLSYHLAPPTLDHGKAVPQKKRFGPWMGTAFTVLARLKFLRGTALDPFGRTAERRTERALVGEFMAGVEQVLARLTPATQDAALAFAALPMTIRGYGHVKDASLKKARVQWAALLGQFGSK